MNNGSLFNDSSPTTSNFSTLPTNVVDKDPDLLEKWKSDLESEFPGGVPNVNFFLFLGSLVLFIAWIVFITFYFSRVVGFFVGIILKRLLRWYGVHGVNRISVGSFSVSILAGKVMFRNLLYVTDDYSLKINDGWLIFSYWKAVPKITKAQQGMDISRIHISLNGFKLHFYNRLAAYQKIAKQAGLSAIFTGLSPSTDVPIATVKPAVENDVWWAKFWTLSGAIQLDISSGRLIAGNNLMPHAFAAIFEGLKTKFFLSDASNDEDRNQFRVNALAENFRISLVKSEDYVGKVEAPPRTMGDGFAILQTTNLEFFYWQDLLGDVKSGTQSLTEKRPVWESSFRFHKNTIISYGPWADKQRAVLYPFFFPPELTTLPVTEMPKQGERRLLLGHNVRISLVQNAAFDIWFMRHEELNAVHSRIGAGSAFEFSVPWITTENGFTSIVKGTILNLESTTSLPFRDFIHCETMKFAVTTQFPRTFNAHQNWLMDMELFRLSIYLLWDHKRFLTDLINEWTSDNVSDLCRFVPYTWTFNVSAQNQFEILLLLNDKNWVDTSSSQSAENIQAAIVGTKLNMDFALPFTDFAPSQIPLVFNLKGVEDMALRVRLLQQSNLDPVFSALTKSTHCKNFKAPSKVVVKASSPEMNWYEIWRTEEMVMKFDYVFHPLPSKTLSDLPYLAIREWVPKRATHPSQLTPDKLDILITIGESEIKFSGLVAKFILSLKDNYFGAYDSVSEVTSKPLHSAITHRPDEFPAEHFRPMDVSLRLAIRDIRAHCMLHSAKTTEAPEMCPVLFTEQLVVEMQKYHSEALFLVAIGPAGVHFPVADGLNVMDKDACLGLSGLQFRGHGLYSDVEVPWHIAVVEYAWTIEIILGNLTGKIRPSQIVTIARFAETAVVLMLSADDAMEIPERADICQHFQNIRTCTEAKLNIKDSKSRIQNCESPDKLKYRLARVAVDRVDLFVIESRYALRLEAAALRVSFCNSHAGSFNENLIIQLPVLKLSQYLNAPDRGFWMKCGLVKINDIDLDLRIPLMGKESYLLNERQNFLQKHDKQSRRLYFLWKKNYDCGCVGAFRFFGATDSAGATFLDNGEKCLAVAALRQEPHQPGFWQSIVLKGDSALKYEVKARSVTPSASKKGTDRGTAKAVRERRKSSDASFHSATSQTSSGGTVVFAQNYAEFLDRFTMVFGTSDIPEFDAPNAVGQWIERTTVKAEKKSGGISEMQLIRKDRKMSASRGESSTKSAEELARDHSALCLQGKAADKVEIFVCPLAIEVAERIASAVGASLRATHPAFLAQSLYTSCTLKHHEQPLTITNAGEEKQFKFLRNLHVSVSLPNFQLTLFQCEAGLDSREAPANTSSTTSVTTAAPPTSGTSEVNISLRGSDDTVSKFITSVCVYKAEHSRLEASTEHNPNEEKKTWLNWNFKHTHLQFVHLVHPDHYDNVYNKIPVTYTTNWTDLEVAQRANGAKLKVIFDLHLTELDYRLNLGNVVRNAKTPAVPKTAATNTKFEARIGPIQVISVLGKPVSDARAYSLFSHELSLYEVVAPSLNAWIYMVFKIRKQLSDAFESVEQYNDVALIKLLADALDSDECQAILDARPSGMHEVKLHGRNMNSCPSCKLSLTLLRYVSHNCARVTRDYWQQVVAAADDMAGRKKRKMAMTALLSHWQTVVCTQVQLKDHHIAQKYRCNTEPEITVLPQEPAATEAKKAADVAKKDGDAGKTKANGDKKSTAKKAQKKVEKGETSHVPCAKKKKKQEPAEAEPNKRTPSPKPPSEDGDKRADADRQKANSLPPGATLRGGFQPGHRRGASTVTQATMATDEEPKDLYNIILRAHKEYKERQQPKAGPKKDAPVSEVNSMEIILPVFFWSIYQNRKLDTSSLEKIPVSQFSVAVLFHLSEIKLDVIEKKLLMSPRNEVLVALTSHHLVTVENIEATAHTQYETKMDEHRLKPIRAALSVDYNAKVQNVRLVVSLASVYFVNDIARSIRACQSTVDDMSEAVRRASKTKKKETPRDMLSAEILTAREDVWTTGVLNKLYDYQRYASKAHVQRETIRVTVNGNGAIKTVLLESMLTDLFISMTLAKIAVDHKHLRMHRSLVSSDSPNLSKSTAAPSTPQTTESVGSKSPTHGAVTDSCSVSLKRANLVVAEHRTQQQQRTPETKQILNCSLRETSLIFERLLEKIATGEMSHRNRLTVNVGDVEGDLPMHAQSIHDVVLRHGPQLNEQLHRIVTQPQPSSFAPAYASNEPTTPPASSPLTAKSPSTSGTPRKRRAITVPQSAPGVTTLGVRQHRATASDAGVVLQKPPETATTPTVLVHFEIQVASVELTAQLLPSLKAKYKLEKATSSGQTGKASNFHAEILEHQVSFVVQNAKNEGGKEAAQMPLDTFNLILPYLKADGALKNPSAAELARTRAPLCYKQGSYFDINITMGTIHHSFSTDLLNQILFAEQFFRSELMFLIEKISMERPSNPQPDTSAIVKSMLFKLTFKGEGSPWLQLTASTPTSTAIRFTADSPEATLTNRLTIVRSVHSSDNEEVNIELEHPDSPAPSTASPLTQPTQTVGSPIVSEQRLFGSAKIQLNMKLGQLYKSALYEETQEELQEFATFMTQIAVQNEEVSSNSLHNYIIILNRPILLIKSSAADKAILLWLNYKNTYDFWRQERQKLARTKQRIGGQKQLVAPVTPRDKTPNTSSASATTSSVTDMNINLSLSIQNGLYVCMPLYSADVGHNMAALVLSLMKSNVVVCVKKELACTADFDSFKVTFIDNFDEHSLSEPWLQDSVGKTVHSNFFFFPHGSYNFCSSAISPSNANESAKWILSVKSTMQGMTIDFDQRIGRLMNLLVHTLSSFGSDDFTDDYAPSDISVSVAGGPKHVQSRQESVDDDHAVPPELDEKGEFPRLVGHENQVRWLERKMHEQALIVTDLIACKASEFKIEEERRKLRMLELLRFKQFRKTMLDKLRPKVQRRGDETTGKQHRRGASFDQGPVGQTTIAVARADGTDAGPLEVRGAVPVTTDAAQASSPANATTTSATSTSATTTEKSESVNTARSPAVKTSPNVDMNIDVQIHIESGNCYLRANPPSSAQDARAMFTKRPSAKDLKKMIHSQYTTSITIPSVDTKVFYTTNDAESEQPANMQHLFVKRPAPLNKNKCFYLALELASMPDETILTPCLADFLEQVLEPLPETLFEPSIKPESEVTSDAGAMPIVAIDTSILPLDVLFHMNVQSSSIRFNGQQQDRSSAADCLLTLPRLTLMASTRRHNEPDVSIGGIYLSATLSAFSISIYSPHQQSHANDSLSIALDKLSVTASRTKMPATEAEKNKVQLVIASNVGKADFNCDLRRLSEVLTFPKPWYRKQLFKRIFLGEQSLGMHKRAASTSTINSVAITQSSLDPTMLTTQTTSKKGRRRSISVSRAPLSEWAAAVFFSMQWNALNINANSGNTMGMSSWQARSGLFKGHLQVNSKKHRDIALDFRLKSSKLDAQGGVISGDISVSDLSISARHIKTTEKAPENVANLKFERIESRIEWLSRTIFIGRFEAPSLVITDDWQSHKDSKGAVTEALCLVNLSGSWKDLEMIITKTTTDDFIRIGRKLVAFFDTQFESSKQVWIREFERWSGSSEASSLGSQDLLARVGKEVKFDASGRIIRKDTAASDGSTGSSQFHRHWFHVLDTLTNVQLHKKYLPIPLTEKGVTVVGGSVELLASGISICLMNGDMNAPNWALFHMQHVSMLVVCKSNYTFVDAQKTDVGVHMVQKLMFKLGNTEPGRPDISECKAVVCKVQQGRNFLARHNPNMEVLEAMIGDPLRAQKLHLVPGPPRYNHNVMELFRFPALEAILTTIQNQSSDPTKDELQAVQSTFISEFHNPVYIETDFNIHLKFLPDLLKSYAFGDKPDIDTVEQSSRSVFNDPTSSRREVKKDPRRYECLRWEVDPQIRFIDRFKWNPPVVDDILRRLQIFDHRTTIPKVLQRGFLDRCDALVAAVLAQILNQAKRD